MHISLEWSLRGNSTSPFFRDYWSGVGVSANYSYTTSKLNPIDPNTSNPTRADSPALLRQAPNNWNFDTTYDKGPISARLGLTHNDRSIFFYNFQDGADLGIKGPNGDVYYYPHTQVDAQGELTAFPMVMVFTSSSPC